VGRFCKEAGVVDEQVVERVGGVIWRDMVRLKEVFSIALFSEI
jgi:hypothetical protein